MAQEDAVKKSVEALKDGLHLAGRFFGGSGFEPETLNPKP